MAPANKDTPTVEVEDPEATHQELRPVPARRVVFTWVDGLLAAACVVVAVLLAWVLLTR